MLTTPHHSKECQTNVAKACVPFQQRWRLHIRLNERRQSWMLYCEECVSDPSLLAL